MDTQPTSQPGQLYIGGIWRSTANSIDVLNPSDEQRMGHIARGTAQDVDDAVKAAQSALDGAWGRLDAASRGRLLMRMAELIRRDAEALAGMESEDVGKPLSLARSDVTVTARFFEYYGGAADKVHGDVILMPPLISLQ